MNSTSRTRLSTLIVLTAMTAALAACGGGGGGASAPTPSPSPAPAPTPTGTASVKLVSLQVSVKDVLATTKQSSQLGVVALDAAHRFIDHLGNKLVSSAYADTSICGTLCQPAYPPASTPTTQALTAKLQSGGTLASLSPVFAAGDPTTNIPCDFTSVGVQVNALWLLDRNSGNALAKLTVPTAVDVNTCALTYTTADYVIVGATGAVEPLNKAVIDDIGDLLPAGDQAFNTSPNAIFYSKSTQLVRELAIDPTTGAVTMTDLTTASEPVWTQTDHFSGQVAYDGTYLVANAANFSGALIYKKSDLSFKVVRSNVNGLGAYPMLDDQGEFIINQDQQLSVIDPATGNKTPWTVAAAQRPMGMYVFEGRNGTTVMGDRCNVWNYGAATETFLYDYPDMSNISLPNTDPAVTAPISNSPSYARMSGDYAYCVNDVKSTFTRYDLSAGTAMQVNLDSLGYLVSAFTMYTDRAYATVTNTSNSSVEYIQVDFTTGQATYLGTITQGAREVVSLVTAGNS